MAVDQELQRHMETWIGFTRFIKWGLATVIILLLALAFFLL